MAAALDPQPRYSPPTQSRRPDSPISQASPPLVMFNNAVFFPSWRLRENKTPASLNPECITHVFYAFAKLRHDGTVVLGDYHTDAQLLVDGVRGGIRACTALRQTNPSLKVVLSLGGRDEASRQAFSCVARNRDRIRQCASSARALVDEFGLDGLDVDWESPYDASDVAGYIALLSELREALPSSRYLLTSALGSGDGIRGKIDFGSASKLVDFFNVICYDFSGPWHEMTGHQSQLDLPRSRASPPMSMTCKMAIDPLITYHKIPRRKIMMGIPVFGRSFLGARQPGDSFSGPGGDNGIFQYYDLPRPGSTREYDSEAHAVYCCGGDGGFVTYDDPTSVGLKAQLVQDHGLGGLFYWDGTGDHKGARSLVRAGYYGLLPQS